MDEEEYEFRDIVSQALEGSGILSKMRAQLRAYVFLALEDEEKQSGLQTAKNKELRAFLSSTNGQLAFGLVKDLLEYFELEHSLAVLTQEAGLLDSGMMHQLPPGNARPRLVEILASAQRGQKKPHEVPSGEQQKPSGPGL